MAVQTVAQTANFVYQYEDSLPNPAGAKARAQSLIASCEADLSTLQGSFDVSGGFGDSNRIQVRIDNNAGLGENFGYQTGGNTQILITPFASAADGDAAAKAVFVAELSEVLMSYRNQVTGKTTWQAGNSMGEALSTVCEALLHPDGYYTSTVGSPRITQWLNSSPRPDWITKVENTDRDFVSFGCGIAFIYYLQSQLGYSLNSIITQAGTTFEETYKNLSGHDGGWIAFSDVLELHVPAGTTYAPVSDNLFPLPRIVGLQVSPATVVAGNNSTGTISLDAPYAGGPVTVTLFCDDTFWATVPVNVTILANASSAEFPITVPNHPVPFPRDRKAFIHASYGGETVGATLTVEPSVVAGTLQSLTVFPTTVVGGQTARGTVRLERAVPTNTVVGLGALESGSVPHIPLPSNQSSVVRVPSSITIPAGQTTGTFTIRSSPVLPHTTRHATIIAGAVVTKSVPLTVTA